VTHFWGVHSSLLYFTKEKGHQPIDPDFEEKNRLKGIGSILFLKNALKKISRKTYKKSSRKVIIMRCVQL
jgi:hypothetical protein